LNNFLIFITMKRTRTTKHNAFLSGLISASPTIADTANDLIQNLIGPITGLFKGIFGGGYQTTTGPRWLAAWYKHYVLGQKCESPTKCVGDADVPPAQAWFTAVTGVPIYDRYRLAALQGWDLQNDRALNNTDAQRVDDYMRLGPLEASVDPSIVMSAVQIAKNLQHHAPVGSWAAYGKAAPKMAAQVSEYLPSGTTGTGNTPIGSGGNYSPIQYGSSSNGGWILWAIIGVVFVVLIILIAKRK
jgi:hypothetical protein